METISVYTVVRGDTLFSIARRFGMSVSDLKALNRLNSDAINVGQTLKVRTQAAPGPTPSPGTPEPFTPPPFTPPSNPSGQGYQAARQQFGLDIRQEAGFRRYFLTVPLLNGGTVVANMRDNITNSRFMVYPEGIMYGGQSRMALDVAAVQAVGLSLSQARALQWVSTHEGQFDAINSYDRAIFSFGFIQFTGSSAVGGSLNRVLASMETNAPTQFQRVFQRVGIDTEAGVVTVLDDQGYKMRGDEAWIYIQRNVRLYGAFIQAGFDPSLVREQLRMANTLYVQPALNFRLNIQAGGFNIVVPRLQDVITSEGLLTLVIALAINQGTGGMSRIVADAMSRVALESGISSLNGLYGINERRIAETIARVAVDERVRVRAESALAAGLSFV